MSTRLGRRLLVVGALAASAALTLAGCASGGMPAATSSASSTASPGTIDKPATMTTVNVGITGATAPPTFLPLIAQKTGIAEKNNLTINFVTIAPNVTAQTLSQGTIDILASPSVETATLQGAPFKIIAGAALSYWHFVAANGVKDWSGLKGKKIALPCGVGATCQAFMDELLAQHKLKPTDVTYINGTAQGTYTALAAGSVDAALTTAPYTYAFEDTGKTHEFDISKSKPYLSTQFTTTQKYIDANPAVITAFVHTMVQAEQTISATPIAPTVLSTIYDFETANGIDPTTLDQKRFLTEFSDGKTWQLVPTKALITRDLALLKANPQFAALVGSASFDSMVYQVPEFQGQYE